MSERAALGLFMLGVALGVVYARLWSWPDNQEDSCPIVIYDAGADR